MRRGRRCRGLNCARMRITSSHARAYSSLPQPKCKNGQFAPDCGNEFGSRGTKLDLAACKCIPICPAGKDYYAASHFWPDTKCLTKSEYQAIKHLEFKEFEKMQKGGRQTPAPVDGDDDGIMTTMGLPSLDSIPQNYLYLGAGAIGVLLLFMIMK